MLTLMKPLACDNESGPGGATNTNRGLTHHLDLGERQAAMQATRFRRKRGLDPAPTAPVGLTDELKSIYDAWPSRFRSKVQLGAGCWEWTASKTRDGYGRFSRGRRGEGVAWAHRYAYELTHGPITDGMVLDHLCRTPACVRPDHLEPIPPGENVRRGAAANVVGYCRSGRHKWVSANVLIEPDGTRRCRPCRDEREQAYRPAQGRARADRTHCPQGHPYDAENTRVRPNGHRECRACHREHARRRYWKQKEAR